MGLYPTSSKQSSFMRRRCLSLRGAPPGFKMSRSPFRAALTILAHCWCFFSFCRFAAFRIVFLNLLTFNFAFFLGFFLRLVSFTTLPSTVVTTTNKKRHRRRTSFEFILGIVDKLIGSSGGGNWIGWRVKTRKTSVRSVRSSKT